MAIASREDRRIRLAEATWRVIAERGIGAVSVRTVAAEAGMAVGSLRHLFPTQQELLEFSAELMIERATARVTEVTPTPDVVDYALAAIGELLPLTPDTRCEFEVNIALIAETPANPGLAGIRDHAHEQLLDLFARIVAMLQDEDNLTEKRRQVARRLLALVDGLGLHLLHQPADDSTAWAVNIVREELVHIQRSGPSDTGPSGTSETRPDQQSAALHVK
ncbi:TetR/AcrR family transcriptional regulator [Rhodococcus sp. 1168]|uniref:TetR/AcrR family transcriptional regulator n=1 Tax=Rhodococcus sp. 1168 TaxID=2018041 RepID=UPI0020CB2149|nr:TetR/AcrR family transcriptional regulator [Rhodococcus sp. 1168]